MADPKTKGYRVVAVSLYRDEAEEADRLTDILKRAGWHKANRSLVIREALARLQEELADKSAEDIFRYFINRYARRANTPGKTPAAVAPAANDPRSTKH